MNEFMWNLIPVVSFFVFGTYVVIREIYLNKKGISVDSWGNIR